MSYVTLKIIHFTGLALTFMGLAGILAKTSPDAGSLKSRWLFRFAHGLGLLLLLASGIALVVKLGQMGGEMHPLPTWVKAKFVIWLLAGGSMALAARLSRFAGLILIFFTALVATAAWLALAKPS
jgi:uncharacterized membrane protein SirB2